MRKFTLLRDLPISGLTKPRPLGGLPLDPSYLHVIFGGLRSGSRWYLSLGYPSIMG